MILGFANFDRAEKYIFDGGERLVAQNINPYLIDGPDIFVTSRNKPLCDVLAMIYGNKPSDGVNLIIEAEEYAEFIKREPKAVKFIKPLLGATEYLNGKTQY